MNAINEFPTELLSKYFAGEANAEEAIEVDDWRNTPQNKEAFEQMQELWNRFSGSTSMIIPAVPDTWAKLEPQLLPAKAPFLRRLLLNRYAVAAMIAGLAVLLTVLWLKGHLSGMGGPASDGVQVVMNSSARIKKDVLPDSSHIVIKPNSSVAYSADFNTNSRHVLLKGEAFFDVAHNADRPFVISIGKLHVQVIGTAFNVRQWLDSSHVEVQVQSGIVKMYTDQNELVVNKGQTGLYNTGTGQLSIKNSINVNSFSYATRHFSFQDYSLEEVCQYIEVAYNVEIILNINTRDIRLSGEFNEIPLHALIDVISTTLNLRFNIDGDTVYLTEE